MENENITQNTESTENFTVDTNSGYYEYSTCDTDYISSGSGITDSAKTGDFATISSTKLSESESGSEVLSVSSGDLLYLYSDNGEETYQIDYTSYLESFEIHLEKIDKTLSLIAFFIIFAWCSSKVVNAVRSFCGIGLK